MPVITPRTRRALTIVSVAVGLLGVMTFVTVLSSVGPRAPVSESSTAPPHVSPRASELARSLAGDEAVVITVLGDSTGDAADEWVAVLAHHIADTYDRSVSYSAWDLRATAYAPAVVFGSSEDRAPVKVFNGSAAGQGPFYSQQHLLDMAPEASDLVIINHGHNFSDPTSGVAKVQSLIAAVEDSSAAPTQVAVILQNPRSTRGPEQEANVAALADAFQTPEVTLIDVDSAFKREGDVSSLLLIDGVHPNSKGQSLWAERVARDLGI